MTDFRLRTLNTTATTTSRALPNYDLHQSRFVGSEHIEDQSDGIKPCGVESPLFASICASSLFPPSFFANVQASVGFCVHRLTAKLLLLFSAVGNIVPLVQAAIPAPPHACCVRKATHHCHESANLDSSYLVIRGTGCCGHECCRAVTTAQWAYPQPRGAKFSKQGPSARVAEHILDSPATELLSSESSRAPPRFLIG